MRSLGRVAAYPVHDVGTACSLAQDGSGSWVVVWANRAGDLELEAFVRGVSGTQRQPVD
jgi:hypothetical protein